MANWFSDVWGRVDIVAIEVLPSIEEGILNLLSIIVLP